MLSLCLLQTTDCKMMRYLNIDVPFSTFLELDVAEFEDHIVIVKRADCQKNNCLLRLHGISHILNIEVIVSPISH